MKNQFFLFCSILVFALGACSKKTESDPKPARAGSSTKAERLSGFTYTKSTPTGNWIGSSFVDQNNGYITGTGGAMIKTTDGGVNYTAVTGLPAVDLYGCFFITASNGFVVGNYNTTANSYTAYKTINNGANWTALSLPALPANVSFRSVYFYDSQMGFIGGGNGTILKTTNGGATWTLSNSGVGSSYALYSFLFFDKNIGLAAGSYGTMFRTTNGGMTWTPTVLHDSRANLSSIAKTERDSVIVTTSIGGALAGGELTTYLTSATKGVSWSKATLPGTYQSLQSVKIFNENNIYMVGGSVPNNTGVIFSKINFGPWTQETIPASGRLCTAAVYEYAPGDGVLFAAGLSNSVIKGQ